MLIQDNRCYGKAILESFQIWNFYSCTGAPMDVWEKQEKRDVEKTIATSVTPGKGREGELCSMKPVEKVNMEAKSTRHYL